MCVSSVYMHTYACVYGNMRTAIFCFPFKTLFTIALELTNKAGLFGHPIIKTLLFLLPHFWGYKHTYYSLTFLCGLRGTILGSQTCKADIYQLYYLPNPQSPFKVAINSFIQQNAFTYHLLFLFVYFSNIC